MGLADTVSNAMITGSLKETMTFINIRAKEVPLGKLSHPIAPPRGTSIGKIMEAGD